MIRKKVSAQVQLGLEGSTAQWTLHTLWYVDEAHVLAQIGQVAVHALADGARPRVQRVQLAQGRCNTHNTCCTEPCKLLLNLCRVIRAFY